MQTPNSLGSTPRDGGDDDGGRIFPPPPAQVLSCTWIQYPVRLPPHCDIPSLASWEGFMESLCSMQVVSGKKDILLGTIEPGIGNRSEGLIYQ